MWSSVKRSLRRRAGVILCLVTLLAFAGALLSGGLWYEGRLEHNRRLLSQINTLTQTRDALSLVREAANQRHRRYASAIRLAEQLIRDDQASQAQELLMQHKPRAGEEDLRDFAWYHLLKKCHTERRILKGHRGEVYFVEFSPHGDLLATAGKDGTVQLWDTTDWHRIRSIAVSPTEANGAGFSPDGSSIATVDDVGFLKLWDTATGRCQFEQSAHAGDAVIVRFTPDGKTIITGGRMDRFIRFWDRTTGAALGVIPACDSGTGAALENAVVSPDGAILATAGGDGVKLWNLANRMLIASLQGTLGAQGLAFSHDGTRLATVHEGDGMATLWDLSTRRVLREFTGHAGGLFAVAFTADDQTLITAGDDGSIQLWDVANGTHRGSHQGHTGRIWNVAISGDGRTIVSAGRDGNVMLWDIPLPCAHQKLPIAEPVAIGFSADSRALLVLELEPPAGQQPMQRAYVAHCNSFSGLLQKRTRLDGVGIVGASLFSADGQLLAIANPQGSMTIWDVETGQRHGTVTVPSQSQPRQFSPEHRYLLTRDQHGQSWRLCDLVSLQDLSLPWEKLITAILTPSGAVLGVRADGTVSEWDPGSGQTRTVCSSPRQLCDDLAISTDGMTFASAVPQASGIHLFSTKNFESIVTLHGHTHGTGPLAFTPDGKSLASSGADRTIKLWDVATGEELLTLGKLAGTITMICFSPDGKTMANLRSRSMIGPNEVLLWSTIPTRHP